MFPPLAARRDDAREDDGVTTHEDGGYAGARVSYEAGALSEADLAATPLAQFETWYAAAAAAGLPEPNAMVVATVAADGLPATRTVLLKQADARGFVFFTNLASRKGGHIGETGRVALTFPWHGMQRQVAARGTAELLPRDEVAAYFRSRPWGSRVGAWASRQSQPVASRADVEARYAELAARWPDTGSPDDVPVPEHWGGYVVRPVEVEFWQGRPSRLHDRLVFVATAGLPALDDPAGWRVERRQP